jgi:hypothetical protein
MNPSISYPDEKLRELMDEQISIAIKESEKISRNKAVKFSFDFIHN